jgi:hypothetical protein
MLGLERQEVTGSTSATFTGLLVRNVYVYCLVRIRKNMENACMTRMGNVRNPYNIVDRDLEGKEQFGRASGR